MWLKTAPYGDDDVTGGDRNDLCAMINIITLSLLMCHSMEYNVIYITIRNWCVRFWLTIYTIVIYSIDKCPIFSVYVAKRERIINSLISIFSHLDKKEILNTWYSQCSYVFCKFYIYIPVGLATVVHRTIQSYYHSNLTINPNSHFLMAVSLEWETHIEIMQRMKKRLIQSHQHLFIE